MDEPIFDRRFKNVCVQGFAAEYEDTMLMMYRDSTFDIDQMQSTMRYLYLDDLSRNNGTKGGSPVVALRSATIVARKDILLATAGRNGMKPTNVAVMLVETTARNRRARNLSGKGPNPRQEKLEELVDRSGALSVRQLLTALRGAMHGLPRPEPKGAHLASAVLCAGPPPADDDAKPSLNMDDDFDKGICIFRTNDGQWRGDASIQPRQIHHAGGKRNIGSLCGHRINRRLQRRMAEYQKLDQPKLILTGGNKTVFATATGEICGHINRSGQPIPVRIFVMVVPGMGRHLFSARAMKSGVNTILETGNSHLQFDRKTSLLLNQHEEDAGLCSFDVSLRAMDGVTYGKSEKTPSTPSVALAAQASADTWHRRLGHMNPRNMKLFARWTATVSNTPALCQVVTSAQWARAHRRHTRKRTNIRPTNQ